MSDADDRIHHVEDHLAIQQLVARYPIAVDERDYDAIAELFTEDGQFRHHAGPINVRTRNGIRTFFRDWLADFGPTFHTPHAHVIDLKDDHSATGKVTTHVEMGVDGKMALAAARYLDRYRKGDDGLWRFADREIWFYYYFWADELPYKYSDELRRTVFGPPQPADLPNSLPAYRAARSVT